ncbi:hypothetical protein QUC31_018683 [Theobroma cacao]
MFFMIFPICRSIEPTYQDFSLLSKKKKCLKSVISRTPLGRIGEPKEVSSLVAFLCLSVACYIAGRIICVDGGVT